MVLVIHRFWLWNDFLVVLGTVALVVLQIKSTTDSVRSLLSSVMLTEVSWNVLQTVNELLVSMGACDVVYLYDFPDIHLQLQHLPPRIDILLSELDCSLGALSEYRHRSITHCTTLGGQSVLWTQTEQQNTSV